MIRCALCALALAGTATADLAQYDFEDQDLGDRRRARSRDANLSMVVTMPTKRFSFRDLDFNPASLDWGDRTLTTRATRAGGSFEPFVFDFSQELLTFSIESGDYGGGTGGGEPDTITARAFSGAGGTGSIIDETVVVWDTFLPNPPAVVELEAPVGQTFASVVIISEGKHGTHSVFYDNATADWIPAPGTALILAIAPALGMRRRYA